MSGSLNEVNLIGNLTRDVESRRMDTGKEIAKFGLATNEKWKSKDGEQKESVEFHNIVIFNDALAKIAKSYLKKGSKVFVKGQLKTRKYTDKDGVEKYSTEVVLQNYGGQLILLGGKQAEENPVLEEVQKHFPGATVVDDDEIPF